MCSQGFYNIFSIFIFITGLALPLQLNNHFKILKGIKILKSPFSLKNKVGSWLDCAICCPVTSGCAAVNYSTEESVCNFYDWASITVEQTPGNQQTAMAVNIGILMFHVTGSEYLTFARAESLCQEFGGQLASVSDLYDARNSGYDLCRCGWVADGSIRFVIQYERPDCDSYSSGVISCKNLTSSTDAYCKFI